MIWYWVNYDSPNISVTDSIIISLHLFIVNAIRARSLDIGLPLDSGDWDSSVLIASPYSNMRLLLSSSVTEFTIFFNFFSCLLHNLSPLFLLFSRSTFVSAFLTYVHRLTRSYVIFRYYNAYLLPRIICLTRTCGKSPSW